MSRQWYEQPSLILQLKALAGARDDLREKNLFEGDGIRPKDDLGVATEEVKRARTPDGTWNDLSDPWMGSKGSGFAITLCSACSTIPKPRAVRMTRGTSLTISSS